MLIVATLLVIAAFIQGGMSQVTRGFMISGQRLLEVMPIVLIAFLVAGLVSVSIPKTIVSRWLGPEAGWKGPFLGSLVGAMVPGGPFFFLPAHGYPDPGRYKWRYYDKLCRSKNSLEFCENSAGNCLCRP